jgi:hypothetical protein
MRTESDFAMVIPRPGTLSSKRISHSLPRGCASDPWRNFSAKLSCPNRREFIRKFFEFAPRGAFQARIPGDFSPFLAKPGIFIRRNIAF